MESLGAAGADPRESWCDLEEASWGAYLDFQSGVLCAVTAKENRTVDRAGLLNLPASLLGPDRSLGKTLLRADCVPGTGQGQLMVSGR